MQRKTNIQTEFYDVDGNFDAIYSNSIQLNEEKKIVLSLRHLSKISMNFRANAQDTGNIYRHIFYWLTSCSVNIYWAEKTDTSRNTIKWTKYLFFTCAETCTAIATRHSQIDFFFFFLFFALFSMERWNHFINNLKLWPDKYRWICALFA